MKERSMVCTHLKELYQLCETNQLRIASSDLVRVTCKQCGEVETCPSVLMDEYDAIEQESQRPSADRRQDTVIARPLFSKSQQVVFF